MTPIQLADVFKGSTISNATDTTTVNSFLNSCVQVGSDLNVTWFIDSGLTNAQAGAVMRSGIIGKFDHISVVSSIAAANGFLLPDSPVAKINSVNNVRQFGGALTGLTDAQANDLVTAAIELAKVADGYDAGIVTFQRDTSNGYQLAGFEVSVDGIAAKQSGDPLVDILGYQPDADSVKRKQALDSLGKLDFSKRQAYLLFTADVLKDGKRTAGTVVCWQKMRDASGYSLGKRDVFAEVNYPPASFLNADLQSQTDALLADPNFRQVISFYDWVDTDDIYATVDSTTQSDTLYSFQVSGLQRKAPATPYLFNVPLSPVYISTSQAADIKAIIGQDLTSFADVARVDSVSPYPAIAQKIFGDPSFGWILAGCNVQASRQRGDAVSVTRTFSYIGSTATALLAAAAAGQLYAPTDISVVQSSVQDSISSYGVSQTLLGIMDGIGLTMFVSGKDDVDGFTVSSTLDNATGGLAKILSAIDPESATIDPHVLAASLANTRSSVVVKGRYTATTMDSIRIVNGSTQQVPSLDSVLGTAAFDLTTYVGISELMQAIRTIYDFYPGRLT